MPLEAHGQHCLRERVRDRVDPAACVRAQVVTVNDYLARRDSEWVGQVHRFLGLSVGLVQTGLAEAARQAAYAADVTYVTNSELGFDYLRDNLAQARAGGKAGIKGVSSQPGCTDGHGGVW